MKTIVEQINSSKDAIKAKDGAPAGFRAALPESGDLFTGEFRGNFVIEDKTDLRNYIIIATNIANSKNQPVSIGNLLSPDVASESIKDIKFIQSVAKTMESIATHNIKVNNPDNEGGRFIATVKEETIGLSSFDATKTKQFYYAGAAFFSRIKMFLVSELMRDNKPFSLFIALATNDESTCAILKELGMEQSSLELLCNEAAKAIQPTIFETTRREQMLVPVREDDENECDYIAITPIPSIKLHETLKKHIITFKDEHPEHRVGNDKLRIGGDNSVNAGEFAAANMGYHSVLKGKIPVIDRAQSTEEQLEKGYSLFSFKNDFLKGITQPCEHHKQKARYEYLATEYVAELFEKVLSYRKEWRADKEKPLPMEHGVGVISKACVSQDKFTTEACVRFASELFNHLTQKVLKDDATKLNADQHKILVKVLAEQLMQIGR